MNVNSGIFEIGNWKIRISEIGNLIWESEFLKDYLKRKICKIELFGSQISVNQLLKFGGFGNGPRVMAMQIGAFRNGPRWKEILKGCSWAKGVGFS